MFDSCVAFLNRCRDSVVSRRADEHGSISVYSTKAVHGHESTEQRKLQRHQIRWASSFSCYSHWFLPASCQGANWSCSQSSSTWSHHPYPPLNDPSRKYITASALEAHESLYKEDTKAKIHENLWLSSNNFTAETIYVFAREFHSSLNDFGLLR